MKKLFFVFLLSFCGAAQAEWQLVVTNLDKTKTYYVDATTIQNKSGYLRAWILVDYSTIDEFKTGSNKTLMEFDCNGRSRSLVFVPYGGSMGQGKVGEQFVYEPKWYFTTPGDINSHLLNFVCQPRWN